MCACTDRERHLAGATHGAAASRAGQRARGRRLRPTGPGNVNVDGPRAWRKEDVFAHTIGDAALRASFDSIVKCTMRTGCFACATCSPAPSTQAETFPEGRWWTVADYAHSLVCPRV